MDSLPRYVDRYTGETFHRVGRRGTDVVLFDLTGRRHVETAAAFDRAYEAVDVVARRVGRGHELWLGDRFEGTLRWTGAAYSLLVAGETRHLELATLGQVVAELWLDPADTRVLGL